MSEADAVDAVGGLQLARGYEVGLLIGADHRAVNRARYVVAVHRHGDLLRHRRTLAGGLVDRGVRLRLARARLKRPRAHATDDERAVAVSRAIEIALIGAAEVVAGDHDAVGMRVIVETHVVRLGERRLHGIVAGGAISRVPIGHGGTGTDR